MLRSGKVRPTLGATLFALTFACAANGAWAQQAVARGEGPNETGGLQEITVTAQRRSESLQKVPIVIVALDAAKLEASGVTKVDDLAKVVPGLQISNGGGIFFTFIRGVGSSSTSTQGQESGVAQYVDDVYIMDQFGGLSAIGDVARVEVLKGPQGTLYGRNTTGGLIHIITADPESAPRVTVKGGFESYNTRFGSLYATGGLTDTLKANLSITGHYQDQGFGRDLNTGQEANYYRNVSARTKWLWQPSDANRVTFAADYLRDTSDNAVHPTFTPGTAAGFNGSLLPPAHEIPLPGGTFQGAYNSSVSFPVYPWGEIYGTSVKWEHTFANGLLFKSISAYRESKVSFGDTYDTDYAAYNIYSGTTRKSAYTFQQEMLVQGTTGPFNYTAGIFYLTSLQHFKVATSGPKAPFIPVTTPAGILIIANPSVDSYSPYGQVDYHFTDKDTLTAGIRYTVDRQKIYGNRALTEGPIAIRGAAVQQRVYTKPTWRLALKHEFTDDLMAYVSYSRGYRSGVYNAFNVQAAPVSPETLDDYEAGLKSQFFDNRVRVSVSGFYYDYKHLQVARFGPGGVMILENAAAAKLYGGELEGAASIPVPVGDLQLNSSVSLLHPKITSFNGCTITTINPPPGAGGTAVSGDCSNKVIPYAPKIQVGVGVNYTVPVARFGGELATSLNYYFSGRYYYDPSNILSQGSYNNLDLDLAYSLPDDRTRVRVYGRNLTDKESITRVQNTGDVYVQFYRPPRIFGIELEYSFK